MMSYNTYPILLPEALGPHTVENPQIPYHLNMVLAKRQGLIAKEKMFKKKYKKHNKILNRLTWLNACSSGISVATGISSVATFATFIGIPVSTALGAASMTGSTAIGKISAPAKKYQKKLKKVMHLIDTTNLIIFGKDKKLLRNLQNLAGRNLRQLNNGYLGKHFGKCIYQLLSELINLITR